MVLKVKKSLIPVPHYNLRIVQCTCIDWCKIPLVPYVFVHCAFSSVSFNSLPEKMLISKLVAFVLTKSHPLTRNLAQRTSELSALGHWGTTSGSRPSWPRRTRALRMREVPEGEVHHLLRVHLSLLDLQVDWKSLPVLHEICLHYAFNLIAFHASCCRVHRCTSSRYVCWASKFKFAFCFNMIRLLFLYHIITIIETLRVIIQLNVN